MRGELAAERYEFKSFKYSSHYWILRLLSAEKGELRILDVGTSSGYLGARLRKEGHYVVGIEMDEASAKNARLHYDAFHVLDIEHFDFPYEDEFDYILFADILEHLPDPESVLRRSLKCLRASGKIIVSVPNVANLVIRLSLFFGRFDYAERGVLDKTHLRFYTLKSLKRMMSEASCRVLEVVPTPLPVQMVFPITEKHFFGFVHEAHYALVRLWKTLLAYQFVVRAAPYLSARRP
jgi:2-polyprenyl-3-methyl-5-hydroxy-6-metoxy-1,4-benzoquinol methylase